MIDLYDWSPYFSQCVFSHRTFAALLARAGIVKDTWQLISPRGSAWPVDGTSFRKTPWLHLSCFSHPSESVRIIIKWRCPQASCWCRWSLLWGYFEDIKSAVEHWIHSSWCLKADETAAGMVHSHPRDGSNHLRYLKTARMNSSILRSPRKNLFESVSHMLNRPSHISFIGFLWFRPRPRSKKKEVQSAAQRTEFVMHMNSVSLPEFTQRNQWI